MKSKVSDGEVVVTLTFGEDEEDITLTPTLRATKMISRQFDGLSNARQKLVAENLDAVIFIIRQGSGMNGKEAELLEEKVYRNGMTADLLVALINYVAILGNGGKPLDLETMGEGDREGGDREGSSLGNA